MKFANIDKDTNKLLGWYSKDIHGDDIPTPNIKVSDANWRNALKINANKINTDGSCEVFDFRTFEEQLLSSKNTKLKELNNACEEYITAGFTSDALDETYYYQSSRDDQANLVSDVLADIDLDVKCSRDNKSFEFITHTALQIKKVSDSFTLHRIEALKRVNDLKNKVSDATTKDDIEAIAW